MKLQTETQKSKPSFTKGIFVLYALKKLAKLFVRATKESKSAGTELLYKLPGVFSISIRYGDRKVRLIKEADEFRILGAKERARETLAMILTDPVILGELCAHEATWQKALAENRLVFKGKSAHLASIMRIAEESDKVACSQGEYESLYGKK